MSEGQELRNDALSDEFKADGTGSLQAKKSEECTCGNYIVVEGVHLPGCPLYEPPVELREENMSVVDVFKAAIDGRLKPSVAFLEKVIGTPFEFDILPDGSVKSKYRVLPNVGSDDFKEDCFALRAQVEETKIQTMLVFKEHLAFDDTLPLIKNNSDAGEMKANLMLAYRRLEEASMRFGKAIQAFDGGKSCYSR